MQSPPAERRAVGLARALQAGALSRSPLPAPRDLAGYKPVLAAHAALATGRQAGRRRAARGPPRALPGGAARLSRPGRAGRARRPRRATRAGHAGPPAARGRSGPVATDAIAAHLVADGVAEPAMVEAVTALRVAIAETPRRRAGNKDLASAAAETVRQAVAAVRACDAGCVALVSRPGGPGDATAAGERRRRCGDGGGAANPSRDRRPPASTQAEQTRRSVPSGRQPATAEPGGRPVAPQPMAPPPAAPAASRHRRRSAARRSPRRAASRRSIRPRRRRRRLPGPAPPPPRRSGSERRTCGVDGGDRPPDQVDPPAAAGVGTPATTARHHPDGTDSGGVAPPAEAGEPFRATLTTAAINSARSERQRPTRRAPAEDHRRTGAAGPAAGSAPRTSACRSRPPPIGERTAPPGSRANWPLVNPAGDRASRRPRGIRRVVRR